MEVQKQIAIYSIPLPIWQRIFVHWYNRLVKYKWHSALKYTETIFRRFCALKNASKQLNQQFDDNFFYEAITKYRSRAKRHLLSVFVRKRINSIIKYESFSQLLAFVLLGKKYGAIGRIFSILERSLPLVAEYSDPAFMKSFLDIHVSLFHKKKIVRPNFDIKAIIAAIRLANDHSDAEMMLILFPLLCARCQTSTKVTVNILTQALKDGIKLNFDNVIGFDEMFATDPTEDKLLAQIQAQPRSMNLIIPQGKLLHLNRTPSKHNFNRGLSNFYMNNSQSGPQRLFVYRNRDNTAYHEVIIRCKELDDQRIIYYYENMETDNLYELILKTSLSDKLFNEYPKQFVAVTEEALTLPLEEQPWFFANLSDLQVRAFASESPNSSVFFTHSRAGQVYITWTQTTLSKRKFYTEVITDLARLLPKDRFVLGLYNNGQPKDLAEHYASKYIMEGNLAKAQQVIVENNLDIKTILETSNVLGLYLDTTPKENINDDMICWLLDQHASLDTANLSIERYRFMMFDVIAKCQEKTLKTLVQQIGCTPSEIGLIMFRRPSYDLLKACYGSDQYKKSDLGNTTTTIKHFLTAVSKNQVKIKSYTKRTLIMLAWKYGNSENFFSALPLELVTQILSYEEIDEPAYYEMLHYLMENVQSEVNTIEHWQTEQVVLIIPFLWKYLFYSRLALNILKNISNAKMEYWTSDVYGPLLRHWFKRIYTSDRLKQKQAFELDQKSISNLTRYTLETPNEDALLMLKFLLKHKITQKSRLLAVQTFEEKIRSKRTRLPMALARTCPATWLAVDKGYLPTIQYLLDEDLLPPNDYGLSPKLQHVQDLIDKHRKDKNQ